ncbi:MAG: hypothetical protein V9E90_08200 [Saprospiraceae bacterium]|jgi:hypothetical protein
MKNLLKAIQIPLFLMLSLTFIYAANTNCPEALQGRWEQLGSRTVKFGMDRDEILVTAKEGFFTGLKIRVTNSALNMHKMVIHFGDGTTQDVELKNNFKAGQESRVIDLAGNRRVITKVVFWYDTKNARQTKAVVELWGKH